MRVGWLASLIRTFGLHSEGRVGLPGSQRWVWWVWGRHEGVAELCFVGGLVDA